MSREQHVEDALSPYLDNALIQEERVHVTAHLQHCSSCAELLADFRYFDTLLANQPRVSPAASLREHLFSTPDYLELIGETADSYTRDSLATSRNKLKRANPGVSTVSRPHLVALPGTPSTSPTFSTQETKGRIPAAQHRDMRLQRFMHVLLAACLLLLTGVGSVIGWRLFSSGSTPNVTNIDGITPPQALHQNGPLPAGVRLVFLRGGSLWSAPEDGSAPALRLTPPQVTVAPNWVVSPALPHRVAGNLLAYIDEKQDSVHVIRTDGQNDITVKQPLWHTSPAWNTPSGSAIMRSLTWSANGSTLAFLAAPTGEPTLYLYSTSTNQVRAVALSQQGAVSHITWSPDGLRVTFALTHDNKTSIFDYNVQKEAVLAITSSIATTEFPEDTLLTLDWSPDTTSPAITWSVGTVNHIHSIWLQHVGTTSSTQPLLFGEYTQAIYSRTGSGAGGWLLCHTVGTDATSISVVPLNATSYTLAKGKQIALLQWTPNGKHGVYLELSDAHTGSLHSVDIITTNNTRIADGVSDAPTPLWSLDSRHVLFNIGTESVVSDVDGTRTQLAIQGSTFLWSTTAAQEAIIVAENGSVSLIDAHHSSSKNINMNVGTASLAWTQIP